ETRPQAGGRQPRHVAQERRGAEGALRQARSGQGDGRLLPVRRACEPDRRRAGAARLQQRAGVRRLLAGLWQSPGCAGRERHLLQRRRAQRPHRRDAEAHRGAGEGAGGSAQARLTRSPATNPRGGASGDARSWPSPAPPAASAACADNCGVPMPSAPDNFDLRRLALPAFGPSLMFGLCEGAILPVLALSARALGASSAVAGLIVALVGLGSLLANLPAAQLTTRFGERRAMIGASVFALLALLLCIVARSVWLFGLAVFMVGLARAVFMLARQTFLIEVAPLHLRARAMSTLGGVHRIGMFVGPFLGA